jgi:hypothetical protein
MRLSLGGYAARDPDASGQLCRISKTCRPAGTWQQAHPQRSVPRHIETRILTQHRCR